MAMVCEVYWQPTGSDVNKYLGQGQG